MLITAFNRISRFTYYLQNSCEIPRHQPVRRVRSWTVYTYRQETNVPIWRCFVRMISKYSYDFENPRRFRNLKFSSRNQTCKYQKAGIYIVLVRRLQLNCTAIFSTKRKCMTSPCSVLAALGVKTRELDVWPVPNRPRTLRRTSNPGGKTIPRVNVTKKKTLEKTSPTFGGRTRMSVLRRKPPSSACAFDGTPSVEHPVYKMTRCRI